MLNSDRQHSVFAAISLFSDATRVMMTITDSLMKLIIILNSHSLVQQLEEPWLENKRVHEEIEAVVKEHSPDQIHIANH